MTIVQILLTLGQVSEGTLISMVARRLLPSISADEDPSSVLDLRLSTER